MSEQVSLNVDKDQDHVQFIKGLIWRRLILNGVSVEVLQKYYPVEESFKNEIVSSFGETEQSKN